MASESELKTLVADVLQKNGVLGKLKAELRASVYNVLQDVNKPKIESGISPSQNQQEIFRTKDEIIGISLVKEFLEFYNLGYTVSVLEPESNTSTIELMNRNSLARELNTSNHQNKPLLLQLIESRVENSLGKAIGNQGLPPPLQLKLETVGLNETDADELTGSDFNTSERTISRSTSVEGLDVFEQV